MMWLTEDRSRLEAFRRGDERLLGEIYRRYAPELEAMLAAGFAFEHGGARIYFSGRSSPFEVDDLVQEAFLRAFAAPARGAYDGLRPFGAWLSSIARNLAIDRYRRAMHTAKLFGPLPPNEELHADARGGSTPEGDALCAEVRAIYRDFAGSLDPREAALLEMRLLGRATRKEVSERTGFSAMQVRVKEKSLLQRLVDVLRRAGHAPEGPCPEGRAGMTR